MRMDSHQISLIVILCYQLFHEGSSYTKFVLHKIEECRDSRNNPMHYNGTVNMLPTNKFEINAAATVNELFTAPLEVRMSTEISLAFCVSSSIYFNLFHILAPTQCERM